MRPQDPSVSLPNGVTFADQGSHLHFTIRWDRRKVVIEMLAAAYLVAFAWFWTIDGLPDSLYFQIPTLLFHVALYGGLYCLVARLINFTNISVEKSSLTVAHGPMPWLGNKTIAIDDIRDLYIHKVSSSGHLVSRGPFSRGDLFSIRGIGHTGAHVDVVKRACSREQALFIKQAIGTNLGISDTPVPGAR